MRSAANRGNIEDVTERPASALVLESEGSMNLNRRDLLAGVGGFAATAALTKLGAQLPASLNELGGSAGTGALEFPRKDDFQIEEGYTYINAAYTHPIPKVALDAARRAAENRGSLRAPAAAAGGAGQGRGAGGGGGGGAPPNARTLFAELIGAKP